jgi:hypothetical protein
MKKLILILLIISISSMAFAQWGEEEMSDKPSWKERIFVGGGLAGLSFSSYSDYFAVAVLGGYKITPKLAGGVQVQYRFTNYKQTPKIKTNDYAVSPFLRYNFYGPLFLHAEYEYLNYQNINYYSGEVTRRGFDSFMAGGGFFQSAGRKAGFYLLALYNFSYQPASQNTNTPYNSPLVIRAGITAGF